MTAILLSMVTLCSCVAPAYNDSQFESKVAATADEAVSSVETASLAVNEAARHGLPNNPVDTAISDAEDTLGAVSGTFSLVQPPDHAMLVLRAQVASLLSDAETHVEAARIAFRDHDISSAQAEVAKAQKDSTRLEAIGSRY